MEKSEVQCGYWRRGILWVDGGSMWVVLEGIHVSGNGRGTIWVVKGLGTM